MNWKLKKSEMAPVTPPQVAFKQWEHRIFLSLTYLCYHYRNVINFKLLTLNGERGFTMVTGCLFLVTFCSLVSLNFSEPGILYQGKASDPWEKLPEAAYVPWIYQRAFQMPWCPHCSFHCPPRTFHCGCCNICEEEFDHHCRWVNKCEGHSNIQLFLLLLMSPCLYLGALLVMCTIFLVSTSEMPFSLDKAMAYPYMAVPATGALLPLTLGLLIQTVAMSTAKRSYEGQGQFLQGDNPLDQGSARNCYITLCAPLGPKYMSEAVWLQREEGLNGIQWRPCAPHETPQHTIPQNSLGPTLKVWILTHMGRAPQRMARLQLSRN
ncbi:palmitoyltransferase ZDHHC19-like [Marmota marmota marmota]|uniref:palmitoyltransferase ZDHHC19-like n=1 Tax=Marmota marmota marmota TaxID=9994 RepID=UPI002092C9F9|nr:palmitoyltransferase ZDHHC19-like [Marmota marmota marmota]